MAPKADGFQKTAFTHELIKPGASMANSADRVSIPANCKCKYCVAARKAAGGSSTGSGTL